MELVSRFIIKQINFDTLAILLSLMLVVAGFTKLGYIDLLAEKIIDKARNRRSLFLMLVFACFFSSMLVTNDVALIIMVPFAVGVLTRSGNTDSLIDVVVLQTVAANLGSMATPIGNPQNVYLFRFYGMSISQFFGAVLPYAAAAFILLFAVIFLKKGGDKSVELVSENYTEFHMNPLMTFVYAVCLIICILAVLGILNVFIVLGIVIAVILISDAKLIRRADYGLLIKFIILFILVGNLADIPFIKDNLSKLTVGREFLCGVAFSQVLSNVPAAIMLSRFTGNGTVLLEGVNAGGLGTLIASMASMISLEYYGKTVNADKKKYVIKFTACNVLFLAVMALVRLAKA